MSGRHVSGSLGVPAYFGPWDTNHWERLIEATPAVVVINPASGPGSAAHDGYRSLVDTLRSGGTRVLGYVATNGLSQPRHAQRDDAHRYRDWYGVDGIFWDEAHVRLTDAHRSQIQMLHEVSSSIASANPITAFNVGVEVAASIRSTAPDAWWVTFEGTAAQHRSRFGSSPLLDDASRSWHLVHSVRRDHAAAIRRRLLRADVGLFYVTSDRMPNPWDVFDG